MNENETVSGLEDQLQGVLDQTPELSGLGAVARRKIARTLAIQIKRNNLTETQTRAMKFLISKVGELTEQTKRDLLGGRLQFQDADIYFRKRVTGGGIQVILDSTNVKRVGTSFIDKNFFPDRMNAVMSEIKVAYGYHATKTDPGDITYSTENPMTGGVGLVPNGLVNGELEITGNDKPFVLLPFSDFFKTGSIVQTDSPKRDFHPLQGLRLIKELMPLNIIAKITDSLALSTDKNHFLDVTWRTVITKPR